MTAISSLFTALVTLTQFLSTSSFIVSASSSSSTLLRSSIENEIDSENNLQVLSFKDPESNRKIMLVGCMHYNPASISLVEEVTSTLGTNQSLHSVLIESCPTRWKTSRDYFNQILTSNPALYKLYLKIFNNEMTTASNIALYDYNVPVILGDQPIEITMDRIQYYFKKTLKDVINPKEGWDEIRYDVKKAYRTVRSSFGLLEEQKNENYLTLKDFMSKDLVASMPFSLMRYPLSILVKNGLSLLSFGLTVVLWQNVQSLYFPEFSTVLGTTFTTWLQDEASYSVSTPNDDLEFIVDIIGTLGIVVTEVILFLRVFVLPILVERDRAIADMIVSVATNENISEEDDKVIVAVLGMAHCNGVRDLIVNREV